MSRPYPTHTPLGRLMFERGLRVLDVAYASGVNPRTLTEYLAGRQAWDRSHLDAIADALQVHPNSIQFDPWAQSHGHSERNDLGRLMNFAGISINCLAQRAGVTQFWVSDVLAGHYVSPNAYNRLIRTVERIMEEMGFVITTVGPARDT